MRKIITKQKLKSLVKKVEQNFPNFLGFIIYGSFIRTKSYSDIDLICVFEKRLPEGSYDSELLGILERPSGLNNFVQDNWSGPVRLDLTGFVDLYLSDYPLDILKRLYYWKTGPQHYVGSSKGKEQLKKVSRLDKVVQYMVSEPAN